MTIQPRVEVVRNSDKRRPVYYSGKIIFDRQNIFKFIAWPSFRNHKGRVGWLFRITFPGFKNDMLNIALDPVPCDLSPTEEFFYRVTCLIRGKILEWEDRIARAGRHRYSWIRALFLNKDEKADYFPDHYSYDFVIFVEIDPDLIFNFVPNRPRLYLVK